MLLSADLAVLGGERVAHAGHESALLGKVEALRLAADGRSVEGKVRDHGPTPYRVAVHVDGGGLESHCECPYEGGPVCKHAVAALEALRFPRPAVVHVAGSQKRARRAGRLARGQGRIVTHAPIQAGTLLAAPGEWALTRDERVELAREDELKARKQRARKEKPAITRVARRGGGLPRFRVPGHGRSGPYTVALRGFDATLASCTCPDFEKSELSTCKHIERVRMWYQRRSKRPTGPVLSVWWRPSEWSILVPDPLREIRCDAVDDASARGAVASVRRRRLPARSSQRHDAHRVGRTGARCRRARRPKAPGRPSISIPPWRCALSEARQQVEVAARLRAVALGDATWRETTVDLGFRMHPYQEHGALFLARRGRAFLADDMGLGKTLQAIVATLLMRKTVGHQEDPDRLPRLA